MKEIASKLEQQQQYNDFCMRNGIVYKYESGRELLVVPASMEIEVIKTAHENGHFAFKKVEECIKQQYHIEKLKEKIQGVVNSCIPCILADK